MALALSALPLSLSLNAPLAAAPASRAAVSMQACGAVASCEKTREVLHFWLCLVLELAFHSALHLEHSFKMKREKLTTN